MAMIFKIASLALPHIYRPQSQGNQDDIMRFYALLILCDGKPSLTIGSLTQKVMQSVNIFFVFSLNNKLLNEQPEKYGWTHPVPNLVQT